jgi:hypothetical protein
VATRTHVITEDDESNHDEDKDSIINETEKEND